MRPTSLIAVIERALSTGAEFGKTLPTLFLFPSATGDELALLRFRAAFRGALNIVLIRYPSLPQIIEGRGLFEVMVEAAFDQIDAESKGEPCMLIGYTFGGFVAWKTAGRLMASGRKVTFLGLIDTRPYTYFNYGEQIGKMQLLLKFFLKPAKAFSKFTELARSILLEKAPLYLACLTGSYTVGRVLFSSDLDFMTQLRARSLEKIAIEPLPIRVTLFRADTAVTPDQGWGNVSGELIVIPVSGHHQRLLEPPYYPALRDQILKAVNNILHRAERERQADRPGGAWSILR